MCALLVGIEVDIKPIINTSFEGEQESKRSKDTQYTNKTHNTQTLEKEERVFSSFILSE